MNKQEYEIYEKEIKEFIEIVSEAFLKNNYIAESSAKGMLFVEYKDQVLLQVVGQEIGTDILFATRIFMFLKGKGSLTLEQAKILSDILDKNKDKIDYLKAFFCLKEADKITKEKGPLRTAIAAFALKARLFQLPDGELAVWKRRQGSGPIAPESFFDFVEKFKGKQWRNIIEDVYKEKEKRGPQK
jgi:hypothetical protein